MGENMSAEYRMSIAVDASGASSGVDNVAKAFANLEKYLSSMDRTLTGIEQGLNKTGTVASKASQNLDKSSKSFDKVEKEAKQAGDSIKDAGKDMDGMNGAVAKLNSTLGMLKGAFVGAMAFAGLGSVMQTADAMKTLDGQIKMATGSAEKHAFAMSEIERIAMANNVSLSSVGEMYVSNERALKQLGKSQEEVVKFTEQVTTAMRLGGGSAEGQAAALTQLGQALASGVLRGDEFNSIAEQAPMIMELMADSLNVTTGELRKMAGEGKLTADVVYKAMTSAGATEKLASMASQSSTTISGALENVRTQWDLAVHGLMNSEGGISSIIAGGISLIADGLAKFGDYIPQINEYISGVISQAKELGTAFLESDAGKAAIEGLKIAFDGLKAGVEGVASVADSVTQFFRENPELAIALASGIGAAAAAFGALKGAIGVIALVKNGIGIISGVLAAVTSPMGLVLLGIAALVTAGVYLYRNWDEIKAKASEIWNGIKETISNAWESIKSFFSGDSFSGIWDGIKNGASTAWEWIKSIVSGAWENIKASFSGVIDWFGGIWDSLTAPITSAFDGAISTVTGAWESIKSVFSGGDLLSNLGQGIQSFFSGIIAEVEHFFMVAMPEAWAGLKDTIMGLFSGMPEPVQEMVANILSIFDLLVQGISLGFDLWLTGATAVWNGITAVISGAISIISSLWDGITSVASTAWEGIKSIASGAIDFISNAWSGIKDGASSAWESVKSTASGAFESVKGYASEKLGQAKTTVSNIASDIGTAWDKAKDGASKAFDSVKSAISEKLNGAKDTAKSAMDGVKSAIASSGIGEAFSKGFDSAKNAVSSSMNGIRMVVTAGITAVKAMIQLNVTTFAIVFNTVFNTIKTIVQTAFGVIKGIVTGDIGAVKSAIQNGLSQLAGIARNAITQMVSAFKSAGAQLRNVGGDIIQGLINGLKAKAAAAVSAAREVASSAVSAFKSVFRTASPSRVTREIGEWVSEGLGIGIDAKAKQAVESAEKLANATVTAINQPLNAKDAKKQAEKQAKEQQKEREKAQKKAVKQLEDYKKALSDAEQALERDLFILSQKSLGNPFAELTTDIKFGKYGTNDTTKLQQLTQEKLYSENTLKANEELKKVKDDIAKVGLTTSQLMQWEYENSEKYLGVSKELFDELVQQTELLEDKQRIYASEKKLSDEILKLDEQILLAGKNEFEILQHQLTYAKEYQGVNEDIKNTYLERVKAAKQEADLVKSRQSLEKAIAIAKNPTDKYAGMRYDLKQQGYDDATVNEMVGNQEKADVATAFNDLRNQMGQSDDPFAKLEAENQRKLEIIQKARGLELATQAEYDEMEKQQQAEFLRAKNELALTQGEQMLGSLTSIAKDAFGEQSKAYKVMFAMEKGMAIARSIMAIQTALASASASAPFPANLGVMATVAAQTASIIGNIKAVTMPVGQAHDGIMSVPKSGTWNLEKGERVLPKHTAKAMDDKLDSIGNGGVNITINIASDGNSQTDAQGANQTAKSMADKIKAVVLETLRQERKQGGLLYA